MGDRYHSNLGNACSTIDFVFLAKEADTNREVLIRFICRYAKDLHRFLARRDLPPSLYWCEGLPGIWTVVMMEYLSPKEWVMLSEK